MKIRQIQELLSAQPEKQALTFSGKCHDCGTDVSVTITREPSAEPGFYVDGGNLYQPENADGAMFFKCDPCCIKDPILRRYKECEVISRVCGYLSPVRNYNKGKASEFNDRILHVPDSSLLDDTPLTLTA